MAQAYRCDRCRGYYTRNSFDHDTKYAKIRIIESIVPIYEQEKHFDLCPACYNDFLNKFMAREAFVKDE